MGLCFGSLARSTGNRLWPLAGAVPIAVTLAQAPEYPKELYETTIQNGLRAIYEDRDDIAEQNFATLGKLRPSFPAPQIYRSLLYSWRAAGDPGNDALVEQFERTNDSAIGALLEWTRRFPNQPDGWRYLASAYGQRSQFAVSIRPSALTAALYGKRMHGAVMRARALDQANVDSRLGAGAYDYFTSRVPLFIRPVAWMLGIGGGNGERGLEELKFVMANGEHMRIEAAMVLASAYWSERAYRNFDTVIRTVTSRFPKLLPAHTWAVSGKICDSDLDGATAAITRADAPASWSALQRGRVALAKNDRAGAERLFGEAIAATATNTSVLSWAYVGRARASGQSTTRGRTDMAAARSTSRSAVNLADGLFRTAGQCPQ